MSLFVITTNPAAEWSYSKFPHPLVTVDYDENGDVYQIVAAGEKAKRLRAATEEALVKTGVDALC